MIEKSKGSGLDLTPLIFQLWRNVDFDLNVAAVTTGNANGADHWYWGESHVNWSSNLVGQPTIQQSDLYVGVSWNMTGSEVQLQAPAAWTTISSPTSLPVGLPFSNESINNPGWVPATASQWEG